MKNYKNIKVWEKSHLLTIEVYEVTKKFPKSEIFGMISQIRRAAVSIPSNIAEGCGRNGENEFKHFLHIALGSANELEYQILLAYKLNYINKNDFTQIENLVIEVKKMLSAFIKKLKADR
jgi:four helix bundle protein